MAVEFGVLIPTREAVMSGRPETAPLLTMAERAEAAGVPFERRVGRFLETLEICRALWRRDHVSFSGKHFTLEDVTMEPKPQQPGGPPIWIGGSGPTALREAARFDA